MSDLNPSKLFPALNSKHCGHSFTRSLLPNQIRTNMGIMEKFFKRGTR